MPRIDILRSSTVVRTPRVAQVEGMFEVPPSERSDEAWSFETPPLDERDWLIGLIVGPSGSGKSTTARELFGEPQQFVWSADHSLLDDMPDLPIKQIVGAMSSVGFSSPPSWLRPFHVLSTGEQFRASMARALLEGADPLVIDEFTSVVDRRVARVASAAMAKAVRRAKRRLIAVACHYDIEEWLEPDWVLEMPVGAFRWRSLQGRPAISIRIQRTERGAWEMFRRHHYLSHDLSRSAQCFLATVDGAPAAFTGVIAFPHATSPGWREHRTVCLPDFQGVGIGNAVSDKIAACYRALGRPYRSVTSNPAMIYARARSPRWRMTRTPGRVPRGKQWRTASLRNTASFEYTGAPDFEAARCLGIIRGRR